MGESLDSLRAMKPLVRPFVIRRGADKSNRTQYFVDLMRTFNQHWSQGANPTRCTKGVPVTDPKYCAGDNVRQYEKLIAEAIASDMIPALNALQKVVMKMTGGAGLAMAQVFSK